jgi:fatty acid desaturase
MSMGNRLNLSEFTKRSDATSWIVVLCHISLVFAPVFLAAWAGPSVYWIAFWVWFGFLMSGLLNLMHECAHFHVFQKQSRSDLLGHWLLGPLVLADFDGYRQRHWKHHIHLGVDGDTKDAYLVDIHDRNLLTLFLRCLFLRMAVRKFQMQVEPTPGPERATPRSKQWVARTMALQAVFFLAILMVAGPLAGRAVWPQGLLIASAAYGCIYLYGIASLTVFAATLRAIAEHQLELGQDSETGRAALRNFQCGPVSWLIFGAYGFAEHATHHREPALPYYHLPKATEELAAVETDFARSHRYLSQLVTLTRRGEKGKYALTSPRRP